MCVSFLIFLKRFWISLWFTGSSHSCEVFSYLPVNFFYFYTVVVGKGISYDLNFLKFVKTCFLAWHVIYPRECAVCLRRMCLYWMEWSVYFSWVHLVCIVVWVSCFLSGLLIHYCTTVSFFFQFYLFAFYVSVCAYMFTIVISSWWIRP
jgi:hypothetical protein